MKFEKKKPSKNRLALQRRMQREQADSYLADCSWICHVCNLLFIVCGILFELFCSIVQNQTKNEKSAESFFHFSHVRFNFVQFRMVHIR